MELSEEEYDATYKDKTFIGEGGFGKVFKVNNIKEDNMEYAVKRINLKHDPIIKGKIIREKECMCQLDHENVVKFVCFAIKKGEYEGKI